MGKPRDFDLQAALVGAEVNNARERAYAIGRDDGYKTGFAEGTAQAEIALASLRDKLAEAETRNEVLEVVIAGLHPAATALVRLARGEGD